MKKSSDKMAFLISAYTEPFSLHALVKKLDKMVLADFYIHIDKKVRIEPFQDGLMNMPNVYFLEDRIRVYWGGYSQVEMQMLMIKEMLRRNIKYGRVINLTGTDYPVVSRKILHEVLNESEVEYICGFEVNSELRTGNKKMIYKYSRFYLMDTYRVIRALVIRMRLPRFSFRRNQISIYYGSEYWALTYACIEELYNNYIRNEPLQELLRFSFVPSEAWMHTMFFNSKWRDRAVKRPEDCDYNLINLSPITYFKYGNAIKILDEGDYEDIISSGRLFARKIVTGRSDRLISMLHENEWSEAEVTYSQE